MLINTNVCYWICRHWRKRQNTYLFPISTKYCDVWCIIVLLYFSFQCLGGITYEIGKKRVIKLVEKSAKFRSMCENLIVTFFYLPFRFECLDTISGAKLSNFKRKLPQRKFCPKIQVIILYFLFRGQAPYCFAVYVVIIIYNNSNNCDIELWLSMPKYLSWNSLKAILISKMIHCFSLPSEKSLYCEKYFKASRYGNFCREGALSPLKRINTRARTESLSNALKSACQVLYLVLIFIYLYIFILKERKKKWRFLFFIKHVNPRTKIPVHCEKKYLMKHSLYEKKSLGKVSKRGRF